jgi:hypothetical protein
LDEVRQMFRSTKASILVAAGFFLSALGMLFDVLFKGPVLRKDFDITRVFLVVFFAVMTRWFWTRRTEPVKSGVFVLMAVLAFLSVAATTFIVRNDLYLLATGER